jgi:hypothetical protein
MAALIGEEFLATFNTWPRWKKQWFVPLSPPLPPISALSSLSSPP